MTHVREVTVTIAIETNKNSHSDVLTQQDDESDEDFATRVGMALTALKETVTS